MRFLGILICFICFTVVAEERQSIIVYIKDSTKTVGLKNIFVSNLGKLKESEIITINNNTIFKNIDSVYVIIIFKKRIDSISKLSKIVCNKSLKVKLKKQKNIEKCSKIFPQFSFPCFPSCPIDKKQATFTTGAITVTTVIKFSKTISKTFLINKNFTLIIARNRSQNEKITCYYQNSKPFQVKIKHCNRPPPVLYC